MSNYEFTAGERHEIDAWVKLGVQPREFLWRIINNDLIGAVAYASTEQEMMLADIVLQFNGLVPPDCWGLKERAIAWRNKFNYSEGEDDGHAD